MRSLPEWNLHAPDENAVHTAVLLHSAGGSEACLVVGRGMIIPEGANVPLVARRLSGLAGSQRPAPRQSGHRRSSRNPCSFVQLALIEPRAG